MRTKKTISFLVAAVVVASLFVAIRLNSSSRVTDMFGANVEALSWQDTPNGVIYDCNDEICIIFDYKNRFLAAGCKAAEGYTCTVSKIEWPDINL